MSAEAIINSLVDSIVEPFLGLSGKDMALKYTVEMDSHYIHLTITAGFPSLLLEKNYQNLVQKALEQQFPKHKSTVSIKQFIRAHKTQFVGKGLRGVKNTIAVASGKGGVGKSTVTVNIAAALAQLGARVGILDADIYGPSIPLMLGTKGPVEIADDFYLPIEAYGLQTMSIGYLTNMEQALIWRGPMLAKSLIQMLDGTRWDELDYLLIDLPPGTSDIHLTLVQLIKLTGAVIVTTPQKVALSDATKGLAFFKQAGINVPLLGLVENMAYFTPAELPENKYYLFGKDGGKQLAEKYAVPFLGEVPLIQAIREAGDEGKPIASSDGPSADAFASIAANLAQQVAISNANQAS